MTLSSIGIILAQLAPVSSGPIDSIGRLTLDGALVIAVGVLWREMGRAIASKEIKIAEKDSQLMAMATKVTETMVMVLESVKEARKASEGIGTAMDNLAANIAALPCSLDSTIVAGKIEGARRHRPAP